MDDEIDIEEHDLMDNPRIKSIFPDLSKVKLEIPDEEEPAADDEEAPEEQYDAIAYKPHEMLYQYEYSFETTTDNVSAEDMPEYSEDEERQSVFYNNHIILGSKPMIDPDVLYQEALNSNTVVSLENWEVKLNASPCYCSSCKILFPTVNALDSHKMVTHSYLVAMETAQKNTARKSTVTSKYCNHCFKTFPDDTSLIKHLYELLPMNNFAKTEDSTPLYKCQKCKMTFTTYDSSRWHKKNVHPNLSHVNNLIIRIQPKLKVKKEIKIEKGIEKDSKEKDVLEREKKAKKMNVAKGWGMLKREGKFFATSSLVPKNTLFQCNVCHVSFISCFSAIQHSKLCKKDMPFDRCGTCKRKIKNKDAHIHKLQHEHTDKIKIYTIHKNIYEKILCKCPKCWAYFDELLFWAHYENCDNAGSAYCPDCNINITSARYESHRFKHLAKKFTKKDFIFVEFHHKGEKKKRIELKRQRKKDLSNEVTLYYCKFCGCCQYKLAHKGHTDGSCKRTGTKRFCDTCGLSFSAKSIVQHKILHAKKSFTLRDIKIICLISGKQINPPVSDMFMCRKCQIHFLWQRLVKNHDCKQEKHITCKVCSKKYNMQAYKVHKIVHSLDAELIPELMKKYNSITNMWNVLYECEECELVTMSYDSAVNHSQNHLAGIMIQSQKHCEVCNFNMIDSDFQCHVRQHVNNHEIHRESFRILKFDYNELLNSKWMELFQPLPQQHRQQILFNSIYRYTRLVKINTHRASNADETKFFCMNCKQYIEGVCIAAHMQSNCKPKHVFKCEICHEIFQSFLIFTNHEVTHDTQAKQPNIVTFNDASDREINKKLSELIKEPKEKEIKKIVKEKGTKTKQKDCKKKYKLYKCLSCLVCVFLKESIPRHNCNKNGRKSFCKICNQFFSTKVFPRHMQAHKRNPNIMKDTLSIEHFSKDADLSDTNVLNVGTAIIFKCECGLHYTSLKTIQKHLDHCEPGLIVSKETCSKCNLLFPTEVLVTHLCNHHSKETKIKIENVKKIQLFKCNKCSLIFTDTDKINSHANHCDAENFRKCFNCHLKFSKSCFTNHKCAAILTDATYINKITVIKSSYEVITVFKCEPCDICYLKYGSYKYHTDEVNHETKILLKTCEYCGLRFTQYTWNNHVQIHRIQGNEYRIKVLDPVSGNSVVIKGNNCLKGKTDPSSAKKRKSEAKNETPSKKKKVSIHNTRSSERISNDDSSGDEFTLKYESETESHHNSGDESIEKGKEPVNKSRGDKSINEESIGVSSVKESIGVSSVKESVRKSKRRKSIVEESTRKSINKEAKGKKSIEPESSGNKSIERSREELIDEAPFDNIEPLSQKLRARIDVNTYDNTLFKCIYCNQHYMKDSSFDYHIKTFNHSEKPELFRCDICDLDFSKYSFPRHRYVHHKKMRLRRQDFIILTETHVTREQNLFEKINRELVKAKVLDIPSDSKSVSDKMWYYKCQQCNVCFINKKMCYNHTKNHEILDPKTYIQCKICDFQFMIDSLKEHMDCHHACDFRIENLMVEEYKPISEGVEPKIDIYSAVDKVQSRLISTTTDMGVV